MNIIKFDLNKLKNNVDGFSYYILGRSYDLEENGVEQDYKAALYYYQKGAEIGYPLCKYSLGISYVLGLGEELEIDEDKGNKILAETYPEILELLNSPDIDEIERTCVEFATGGYEYFGVGGIKRDYKRAFETIKNCADKGHLPAIYDLGANFYYNGNGTEKNDKLAEYYLNIAKNAGLKRAIKLYNERDYEEER